MTPSSDSSHSLVSSGSMSGSWLGRPVGDHRALAFRGHRRSLGFVWDRSLAPSCPLVARAVTSPTLRRDAEHRYPSVTLRDHRMRYRRAGRGTGHCGRMRRMRSEVITVRTGSRPTVRDITERGRAVRRPAPATACCTSSSRTPPPGWRSSRPAPAPTTTCCGPWTTCCPPTTGGGTGTARPGTAATTCCRRSCRRTRRCRCSAGGSARHLAVDLPGRHQRRQPRPPGALLVPARLTGGADSGVRQLLTGHVRID